MVRLMEQAHRRGGEIVVFPEPALTTFFPRHYHADIAEADGWFEAAMPSNETAPLFAAPLWLCSDHRPGRRGRSADMDEKSCGIIGCVKVSATYCWQGYFTPDETVSRRDAAKGRTVTRGNPR
jgi:hypothetical protein